MFSEPITESFILGIASKIIFLPLKKKKAVGPLERIGNVAYFVLF